MAGDGSAEPVRGAVPLASAIAALRDELARAWWDGQRQSLRFKPSPLELTLQVAVTSAGKASGGVRWWLIELGGEASRQSVVTQTVKVNLEPVLFDEHGEPLEFLVEGVDSGEGSSGESGEVSLDAAD
jgi:hypothetical protein